LLRHNAFIFQPERQLLNEPVKTKIPCVAKFKFSFQRKFIGPAPGPQVLCNPGLCLVHLRNIFPLFWCIFFRLFCVRFSEASTLVQMQPFTGSPYRVISALLTLGLSRTTW